MHQHLTSFITSAITVLRAWEATNPQLCDLMRPVHDGWYYSDPNGQAWYLYKYYPAYYAENWLIFRELLALGVSNPRIISLGCGCMVDAAAARRVFANFQYHGYDINNWKLNGATVGNHTFVLGDLNAIVRFPQDTNVILFPRSVGDLDLAQDAIAAAINTSNFTAQTVYACFSLRQGAQGVTADSRRVDSFVQKIAAYKVANRNPYRPSPSDSKKVISQVVRSGWTHADTDYGTDMIERCKTRNGCDGSCLAAIGPQPMLKMKHLAYDVVTLAR